MNATQSNSRPDRLDAVASIAAMRRALKAAFPGLKISVRMSRGTAYGNASVSWTDGPSVAEVEAVTEPFRGRGFDGMTDSTTYTDHTIEHQGATYRSGVGLVLTSRGSSPAEVARVVAELREHGYRERFEGCFETAARAMLRGCDRIVAADHHSLTLGPRLVR